MDDYLGVGVRINVDYDVGKWVMIPPSAVVPAQEWAARTAQSWAKDLGRESDANWPQVLEQMLLLSAGAPGEDRYDARMVHIAARPGEAASIVPANLLMSEPMDQPGGLAAALADPDNPDLVEPPIAESLDLHPGVAATRIVSYRKGSDPDSVMASLYLTWRAHEHADLTWSCPSYDIGRLLAIRDDLVDLARATSLVPIDESPS